MDRWIRWGLLVCLIACLAAPAWAAPAGPRATLQRLNGDVESLLRKKTVPGSEDDKKTKDQIKARASELLDYAELARRALGEHWDKMKPAQRTDFVNTFKDLIERNYVKQLRTNLDYTVTYGDEKIEGNEAAVMTHLKLKTKGKATEAEIIYKMIKNGDRWMVWDVITDELSLVRNYRSQFQKIIGQSGYDGLIKRMKDKRAEQEKAAE